jgi:hypothetical protein
MSVRSTPALVSAALLTFAGTCQVAAGQSCGHPMVAQHLMNLLPSGEAERTAVASGPWSDPATWGGATDADLPRPGDDVLIPAGIAVTYDVFDDGDRLGPDTTRVRYLRVDGELRWATDRSTRLYVDTLYNAPDAFISIGTEADPLPAAHSAEIVFIADTSLTPANDPRQVGRGFVPHGPHRVVGADKTDFAALAGDALAGDTTLTLAQDPSGWELGDRLVLGGTSFNPNGSNEDNSRFRDEVLIITSINGSTIGFVNEDPNHTALRWDHARPDGVHFDPEDLTLYVANLTRNITFRSELDPASPDTPSPTDRQDLRRGHVMVMHEHDSIIRNAAFVELGRNNKNHFADDPISNVDGSPAGGTNTRGRYPVHHHRNLPQNYQPVDFSNCPPAEVTGCVVEGSPGWGFVHHDSYSVFADNVAFDVLGSAFVQESGNEIGLWQNNISIKTTGDDDPDLTVEPFGDGYKRVTNFDFGFNGEAYWVQGASQVRMIDNIAISAAGGGIDMFSDVDGNSNRDREFIPVEHLPADRQHIVTEDGRITVNRVPTRTISGFEVYNADFGFVSWNHMRNQGSNIGFVCPCDGNVHREYGLIEGFKFWNIYGQGVHLQYSSQLEFRNGIIASSDLATPNVNDKPAVDLSINGDGRGYGFGMNGPTKRLVLDNVTVEGWRFGVRTPLEGQINDLDTGEGVGSEGAQGLPLRRSVFRDLKLANNDNHFYRRQNGFTDTQPPSNFLVLEGGDYSPAPGNNPPAADFTYQPLGHLGVVRLSGLASFDADTPGDGLQANNPLSAFVNDSNYIIAYAWDLDEDGATDGWGERITHRFPPNIQSNVTLTVWDHQGVSHSITRAVTPTAAAYGEVFTDNGFDAPDFRGGLYALGSEDANMGWHDARAELVNGAARLHGQFNFSSIAQTVYDDFAHRGTHTLRFDFAMNDAPGTNTSRVTVRVFGIHGEFGSAHSDATPEPEGAIPVEIDLLFEEAFTGTVAQQTVERSIDLGMDGYQYLYIGFEGDGLSRQNGSDFATVDNVSLVGDAPCPGDADGNAAVGANDLLALLVNWGTSTTNGPADGDFDGSGSVGTADLLILLAAWGATC